MTTKASKATTTSKPAAKPVEAAKPAPKPAAEKLPDTKPPAEELPPATENQGERASAKAMAARTPADPVELTITSFAGVRLTNTTDRTILVDELQGNKLIERHEISPYQEKLVADHGNHFKAHYA